MLIDIDFFQQIARYVGSLAARGIVAEVAGALRGLVESPGSLYSLGEGQFAALLPPLSSHEAAAWAETARQAIRQLDVPTGVASVRLSASFGVADTIDGNDDAAQVLARAADALRIAKSSGRDCVIRWAEFPDASRDDATPPLGMIGRATAADLLSPWPMLVAPDQPLTDVQRLLDKTGLPALPRVDHQGRLSGLIRHRDSDSSRDEPDGASTATGTPGGVIEYPATDVRTFEEDAPFPVMLEFFVEHRDEVAVVVREGMPLGLLTADHLVGPATPVGPVLAKTPSPFDAPPADPPASGHVK